MDDSLTVLPCSLSGADDEDMGGDGADRGGGAGIELIRISGVLRLSVVTMPVQPQGDQGRGI